MSCTIIPALWSRKQGALGKTLIFGLYLNDALLPLASLTGPAIYFRNRAQPVDTAVAGAGTLSAYVDTENDPPLYNVQYAWHATDPDDVGVYLVGIRGTIGGVVHKFPDDGSHLIIRIMQSVS